MQEWDALHASLLYEVIELRESLGDELETWKHKPRVKGLRSPFLLKVLKTVYQYYTSIPTNTIDKMTQRYAQSYPALRNPDTQIFSEQNSAPTSTIPSSWARWRTTETARRTIFFANIINLYLNYNHNTGSQLPYYEPLDDDLILNMPLPCSEAVWAARDEASWMMAIQTDPASLALQHASDTTGSSGASLPGVTLKTVFSKYSKDQVQREFGRNVGFGDSEQLRSFIVLCACEQFA